MHLSLSSVQVWLQTIMFWAGDVEETWGGEDFLPNIFLFDVKKNLFDYAEA